MKPKNRLICDDCLQALPTFPDKSVDLVFGSPPYQNARDLKQDPFPVFASAEGWVSWMTRVYIESLRVCKGLVAFVIQGRTRNYSWSATPCLLAADLVRMGITIRDFVIYHRVGIPGSGGPDWLRHDCEYILCATNGGKLPWSDNTAMGHPPKWGPGGEMSYRQSDGTRRNKWGKTLGHFTTKAGARKQDGTRGPGRRKGDDEPERLDSFPPDYVPPTKANPGNLILSNTGGGHIGSKYAHKNEAPFPESLAEFIIKSFCPPGGTVLDPFAGSCTVPAVAKKLNRRWIGIDIRQSQIKLGRRRLKEVEKNLLKKSRES